MLKLLVYTVLVILRVLSKPIGMTLNSNFNTILDYRYLLSPPLTRKQKRFSVDI